MDKMPTYKEGYITLWCDGKFVQVPLTSMPEIVKKGNITEQVEVEQVKPESLPK